MKLYMDDYFYENHPSNDNQIAMVPIWSGLSFEGYAVVKGNWKPDGAEFFEV